MQLVEYWIDNQRVSFELDGETETGPHTVLLESDDNIIRDSGWDDTGYHVAPFLSAIQLIKLRAGFTALIREVLKALGIATDDGFCLEKYHLAVSDVQHAAVIKHTRVGFVREQFPIGLEVVEQRISEICGLPLTVYGAKYTGNPFFLRIVRPHKAQDNNPPHRDVWLDHLRDGVNIYGPIAGSNALSSLPVLPGSHRWSENEIERSISRAQLAA